MTNITKIKRIYILSFLFSLHIALSAYVNSTFLTNFFSVDYVGLLYTAAAILTLILLSTSPDILKHFGNRRFILVSLVINMLSLVGLITSHNQFVIGASFISLSITNTLVFLSIDIFIEHFGKSGAIGKTRGLYLTITNMAWVVSPLITGLLISNSGGYKIIYIIALVAMAIMTLGLVFSIKTFKDKKYERTPFLRAYRYLKTNSNISAIFIIDFILQFFYALMVVYIPIYLYKYIGFNWEQIGVIFTIMFMPFILFGFPIGILIDKYNIEKRKLLTIGLIIMSLSTISISAINVKNIALWALILFITRVGATMVETTSEIYFFTHVREKEAYLLGLFRDMFPLSYVIAPLIATSVFFFFPFKSIFIFLGIIILSGLYYVTKLKRDHKGKILDQSFSSRKIL